MIKQKENGYFILNENTFCVAFICTYYFVIYSSLSTDHEYVNPLV